jgi:transposase-like protein
MTAWRICYEELSKLPDNNQFTFNYCNRFSSIFLFDGKYFNVAGEASNWVFLWGIDYLRHDIPAFIVAPTESYQSWAKLFAYIRIINHFPQLVVCDDNVNLKMAAREKFPAVRIQTCYNHFKENMRRVLHTRSEELYQPFMRRVEKILDSSVKLSNENFQVWMSALVRDYGTDPVCLSVILMIRKYQDELFAYRGVSQAPLTTNLIEGMNGHLEKRLFSLQSFQSVAHAKLWFNGYVLKRRMTKFTDCRGKFKHLNGKTGVQMTKRHGVVIPSYF